MRDKKVTRVDRVCFEVINKAGEAGEREKGGGREGGERVGEGDVRRKGL